MRGSVPWSRWLALAGTALIVAGLWRTFRRVEVTGSSMSPALRPGDRLVVMSPPFGPTPWPKPGAVVAVRDPRRPDRILIKRVVAVDHDTGTVEVMGDHRTASTDSRSFGPVVRSAILGRAVYRYGPSGRSGPLPPSGEYHRG
ncbi:MAG: nickel-type superoxide dismutase maturation protease [Acidimicrobiales bacterium]